MTAQTEGAYSPAICDAVSGAAPNPAPVHPVAHLDVLDGWRTLSVALVILNHIMVFSSLGSPTFARPFDSYGHLGVQFFFFISGFVICRSLNKEIAQYGRASLGGFHIRRIFRILPPLLVYVGTLTLLAVLGSVAFDLRALPNVLTFTCNIVNGCGGYAANHLWSLGVEAQFYLVFPLAMIAAGSRRRPVLGITVLLLPIVSLVMHSAVLPGLASYLSDFFCVAAGVGFALYEDRVRALCLRLPAFTPILLLAALLVLVSVADANRWSTLARYFVLPSCIGLCIMTSVYQVSYFHRFLSSAPMREIGAASYSVYLWQQLATAPYPGATILFYAATIAACLIFSLLSFRYVEKPLIATGARLARSLRRPACKISYNEI